MILKARTLLSWAICLPVLCMSLCERHVTLWLSRFEIFIWKVELQRHGQWKASSVLSDAGRCLHHDPFCRWTLSWNWRKTAATLDWDPLLGEEWMRCAERSALFLPLSVLKRNKQEIERTLDCMAGVKECLVDSPLCPVLSICMTPYWAPVWSLQFFLFSEWVEAWLDNL